MWSQLWRVEVGTGGWELISADDGTEAPETAAITEEHAGDLHVEGSVLVILKSVFENNKLKRKH